MNRFIYIVCGVIAFLVMFLLLRLSLDKSGSADVFLGWMKNQENTPASEHLPKHVDKAEHQSSPRDPAILRDLRRLSVSHDLARSDVTGMTSQQKQLTMHSVLDNTDTVCHRKLRMGKMGDGGWEICDDVDVRPRAPCVVYSFGIKNDFSFDDDTASTYGCHVYSFDPSMKDNSHNRSDLVHFYKIGLSGRTFTNAKRWNMYTFSDIRKLLGHEKTQIDVVKMDIEESEWSAVPDMVRAGELKQFKQLLIEFHVAASSARLKLLQDIERQGYRSFYTHKNVYCQPHAIRGFPGLRTNCYEVHYVRRPHM